MYYEMNTSITQKFGVMKWPQVPDGVGGFQWGDRIVVPVPEPVEFVVNCTQEHPPSDFVTSFMPVFSDRLVDAFRNAGVDNLQTFRARLVNPATGDSWDTFQVVNIIGAVACADLENSEYKDFMGEGKNFSRLVIDVEKAKGALMFRLAESRDKIIVHYDVLVSHMYDKNSEPIFEEVDFEPITSRHNIK